MERGRGRITSFEQNLVEDRRFGHRNGSLPSRLNVSARPLTLTTQSVTMHSLAIKNPLMPALESGEFLMKKGIGATWLLCGWVIVTRYPL